MTPSGIKEKIVAEKSAWVEQMLRRIRALPLESLERRLDSLDQKLDQRTDALDQKISRHFVWLAGVQVTTLVALVGALLAR